MVAPLAGARIETKKIPKVFLKAVSLPSRERELKHTIATANNRQNGSLPSRERELKHTIATANNRQNGSLPSRERELKQRQRIS